MKDITSLRRKILDREYSHLNDEQRQAVYYNDGPLLILAGAGSGKTTTVVSKISYLIKYGNTYNIQAEADDSDFDYLEKCSEDMSLCNINDERYARLMTESPISAHNVLAITFTNKAAGEMRERLESKFGIDTHRLWALTFHSLCVRILRNFIDKLGFSRNFTIYDDHDSMKLTEACIKELNLPEIYKAKSVRHKISSAKDNYVGVDEFRKTYKDSMYPQVPEVYRLYQEKLLKANALDFDDLIFLTVRLLTEFPAVLRAIHKRFQYLLVDEYQDTNPLQYKLVSLLSNNGKICVVGDDDQSIYRFMGASIENILSFEKTFEDAKVLRLERNYRSTQTILDAANAVISNNENRKGKNMWTENGDGKKIIVNQLMTQRDEGEYIARTILTGIGTDHLSFNDYCVLYRTNGQSNAIEMALRGNGIPYRVFGGQPFFKRKEVQDVLAYMNVILNPNDTIRLKRIINEPKRGIGDTTIEKIEQISSERNIPIFEVIRHAEDFTELQRSTGKLASFANLIDRLIDKAARAPVSELYQELLFQTGYRSMLKETYGVQDAKSREDNLDELYNNIVQFLQNAEEGKDGLQDYLEQTALISSVDNLDENERAVTLMTMHCSKGLEFPNVFIAGFEEGLFPSPMSENEEGGVEEERRLCYVALTRAKSRLYLLSVNSRMMYGQPRGALPSRFLREIPSKLTEQVEHPQFDDLRKEREIRHPKRSILDKPLFAKTEVAISSKKSECTYKEGQRVNHKVFGDGTVMKVTPMAGDSMIEVNFDKIGTKKLMSNYAKITILD